MLLKRLPTRLHLIQLWTHTRPWEGWDHRSQPCSDKAQVQQLLGTFKQWLLGSMQHIWPVSCLSSSMPPKERSHCCMPFEAKTFGIAKSSTCRTPHI